MLVFRDTDLVLPYKGMGGAVARTTAPPYFFVWRLTMPENATGFWRNRDIHYCCDCHRCIGAAKVVVWEFLDRHV